MQRKTLRRAVTWAACGILLALFPVHSHASSNDHGILSAQQTALTSEHLRKRHLPEKFIPDFYANAGLAIDDPDNSKFESTIIRTYTAQYIKQINEILLAVSPLLHATFKCDGDFSLQKRDSFEMIGTTQLKNAPGPSRLFKDSWTYRLCDHHSNINFLTFEKNGKILNLRLLYIGKSATDVQLFTDTNRAVSVTAAAELGQGDHKCAQKGPALIDAIVADGSPAAGRWTEVWRYAYCGKIETFNVEFSPSPGSKNLPANKPTKGTVYNATLKGVESF